MTLRFASSILAAGCWSWQPWLVLCDETDREFFPLSGGIDDGVQVTISVQGIGATHATIEFVDRERRPTFTFDVDVAGQTITRSSDGVFSRTAETFGGWPSGLGNGAATFVFTKRRFDMAVSIKEGDELVRYPWYDYANVMENDQVPLFTHVAVYSGFTDPEVTLERPACQSVCHPDECLDETGTNLCADGGCYTVTGGTTRAATACSTSQATTPGASMHCCDGDAVTPRLRRTLAPGAWARTSSNPDYLRRVCTAFGIADAQCPTTTTPSLSGVQARINATTGSDEYEVFAPAFVTDSTSDELDHALPAEAFFQLPAFGLFEAFENRQLTFAVGTHAAGDLVVDGFHGFIVSVADRAEFAGFTKGQYVHLVKYQFPTDGPNRTTRINHRSALILDSRQTTMYVSDHPVEPKSCVSEPDWTDENDDNCAAYGPDDGQLTGEEWCTISGYATDAGRAKWGPLHEGNADSRCSGNADEVCLLPRAKDPVAIPGREAALIACCACGGGRNEVAEGFDLDPPAPAPPAQAIKVNM